MARRKSVQLTKGQIEAAKGSDKIVKHYDGGGLHLAVMPSGLKVWRLDIRYQNKPLLITLGRWPEMDAETARGLRSQAKALLRAGRDPRGVKIASIPTGNTFGEFVEGHLARVVELGRTPKTVEERRRVLTAYARGLFPLPAASITSRDVIACLRPLESAGKLETARRVKLAISAVLQRACVAGVINHDATKTLGEDGVKAPQVKHRPALVDRDGFAGLLASIECYRGDRLHIVRDALRLLALTALRPGEARLSKWSDIDLDAATWTIGAERHKMRREHVTPLSQLAVDILTGLKPRIRGGEWVFPSPRDSSRPISVAACNAALRAMGYAGVHCAHGFRASFRSLAGEARKGKLQRWSRDSLERQLGHVVENQVERAYNRGDYMQERIELSEWWSRRCETLERSARKPSPRVAALLG